MENMAKKKKPIFKRWWFWVIIVIIIIGVAGANGSKKDDAEKVATNSDQPKKAEKKEEKKGTKVTYENFSKIQMNSKYEDVVVLLGEGKEGTSSEISGIKTSIYEWNGAGVSNMNVTVQNGVITGKTQIGLKTVDNKVTMDKYNQVKEGMTYNQVKGILGEGQIMSQSKIMDMESIMYSWVNKDGSNINCSFSGDKLETKAQFNLK